MASREERSRDWWSASEFVSRLASTANSVVTGLAPPFSATRARRVSGTAPRSLHSIWNTRRATRVTSANGRWPITAAIASSLRRSERRFSFWASWCVASPSKAGWDPVMASNSATIWLAFERASTSNCAAKLSPAPGVASNWSGPRVVSSASVSRRNVSKGNSKAGPADMLTNKTNWLIFLKGVPTSVEFWSPFSPLS
ncbi:hypothetical protein BC830DRAFT_768725 [Chytriomyces sp. MP71]|nr:hypothetical protein BC830DRAFT_768725 [Chytriomyces sp. MP71]